MNRSSTRPIGTNVLSALRCFGVGLFCLLAISGCSRFRPSLATSYVYVTSKSTFLRDRVAAVSNRTATVNNGDRLKVLERGRQFVRVQTEKGEQGWIRAKETTTQDVFDGFTDLKKTHEKDSSVASAVVRDEAYLHLKPGRDTERLFRLPEGEKLQLVTRATLPKVAPTPVRAHPPLPPITTAVTNKTVAKTSAVAKAPEEPPAPPSWKTGGWCATRKAIPDGC
jgi:hypothetical protein